MADQAEGGMEFSIMSLVKDPLFELISALAENIKDLRAISEHLESVPPRSEEPKRAGGGMGSSVNDSLQGPDATYGLNQQTLERASLSECTIRTLQKANRPEIFPRQSELTAAQAGIRMSIREEHESRQSDQERATGRRHDLGPLALKVARAFALKRAEETRSQTRSRKRQKR